MSPSIAKASAWLIGNARGQAATWLLSLAFASLSACSSAPKKPVAQDEPRSTVAAVQTARENPDTVKPVEPQPPTNKIAALEEAPPAAPARPKDLSSERNIYFLVGNATISPSGLRKLQRHAQYLQQNPKRTVTLIGYSESFGSRNYTLAIMESRLAAVSSQLHELGVEKSRIRQIISGDKGNQKSCEGAICRQRVEIQFH